MFRRSYTSTLRSIGVQVVLIVGLIGSVCIEAGAQERRAKIRISNAGLTITALPLLAARDWGIFTTNGMDVKIVVMAPPIAAAALSQGDVDYVAGVGPASVSATLSGLPSRAIWFSSDRISYWLMAKPQFKSVEDLKGEKSPFPVALAARTTWLC